MKVNKIAQLTGHNASIYSVIPAEDSNLFFSGAGEGWLVRWDLNNPDTGRLVAKVETQIFSLLYLPPMNRVVAGNMNGGVHWIDLAKPETTQNIAHHKKGVFDIQYVKNAVFTLGGAGMMTKWSIEDMRTVESIHLSSQSLRCLAFSKKRNEIAVGASDHNIYILDADSLILKKTIEKAHDNSVFALCYSPDEKYLLSGGRDAHLKVWKTTAHYELLNEQPAHWFTINHITYHPNGLYFATASRDKTIKIWDAKDFKLLKVLDVARDACHANSVNKLYWSDFENYLISCSDDRSIIVWELVV